MTIVRPIAFGAVAGLVLFVVITVVICENFDVRLADWNLS